MAETVTIGQTQGGVYTWASPAIVWNDARASYKTWAIAYDIYHTADISSTLAFAELRAGAASKSVGDALALLDQPSAAIEKFIAESALVSEAVGRSAAFDRVVFEGFFVIESDSKAFALAKSDALALLDQPSAAIEKFIAESTPISEAMGRTIAFSRAIAEGISAVESISKASALAKSDTVAIGDELRRNANAIISDILIGGSDITQAQFDAELLSGSAPGFTPFRRFIDGDHEYKDAIFKGTLASSNAATPRITALEVSVDVPDVYDRGTTLTSASAAVTVTCARKFYIIPEVVATCKGGTVVAVPRISNIQISAVGVATFDIELVDSANSRVAGTVSWSAHGY